jgi:hypothetical protein
MWKDSNWELTRYKMQKPFVLISDGQGYLTLDSVSKAADVTAHFLSCSGTAGLIHCQSKVTGDTLSFSPDNQSGVVTNTYGALMPDDGKRDTLHLRPFECAKG